VGGPEAGGGGGGRQFPRDLARVSPLDSAVQGGDAVWEGLRVYDGKVFMLERHLKRLFASAKALDFKNVHTKDEITAALFTTLAANGMRTDAHVRLTLSRGEKTTSSMNPKFNVFGTTLIVLAEWKPVVSVATYDNRSGVALVTGSQRRNPPMCLDSNIHHNNLLNNILPKIQANLAGAADALMLDVDGYVAETNGCNVFCVVSEESEGKPPRPVVLTPTVDHCLPGVTRELVIALCSQASGASLGIARCEVRRVSLAEFHAADEVFMTGTMGELTPVVRIDGRTIGQGTPGPLHARLAAAFRTMVATRTDLSTPLPSF